MGDKSPKAKARSKKHDARAKEQKRAAHDAKVPVAASVPPPKPI